MTSHDYDPNPDGIRVATRMRESMEHVHTDPDRLLTRAVLAGRSRRRRREILTGLVTAVTVAGLGLGSTAAVTLLTDRPTTRLVAAPPSPDDQGVSTPSTPTPSATVAPTPRPDEPVVTERQLPARVAALYLTRLVPSGKSSEFQGQQSENELYVQLALDRGEGPVAVQVNVQGNFLGAGTSAKEPTAVRKLYRCQQDVYLTCASSRDDDGGRLLRTTQRVGQATVVVADQLRPNGTRVVVMTGDTDDVKHGGTPRRGLTLRQAAAIATSPAWDLGPRPAAADQEAAEKQIRPWTLLPE